MDYLISDHHQYLIFKVHYHVHKSSLLVPILIQMNLVNNELTVEVNSFYVRLDLDSQGFLRSCLRS